jgi:hypothetical protein
MMCHKCAAILAVGLMAVSGCHSSDSLTCASDDACPQGHTCLKGKCMQRCDNDLQCARGSHCEENICASGERTGVPTLDRVGGLSSRSCKDPSTNTSIPCIGTGFVVTGTNLTGVAWTLQLQNSATPTTYNFNATAATSTDTRAEIAAVLPTGQTDIEQGMYLLVAANQSGSGTAAVQLLRGETGAIGPTGPTGPTGPIGPTGPAGSGGGGSSGTLTVVEDGTVKPTVALSGNRLLYRVHGQSGAFSSTKIDNTKLLAMCGDDDGCSISLGVTHWNVGGVADAAHYEHSLRDGGACRFYIKDNAGNGKRTWSVSPSCFQYYATNPSANNPPAALTAFDRFMPYFGNENGLDAKDATTQVVLNFWNACYFAESIPSTCTPAPSGISSDCGTWPDADADFYLFSTYASGWYWYPGNTWWPSSDTSRACELLIED